MRILTFAFTWDWLKAVASKLPHSIKEFHFNKICKSSVSISFGAEYWIMEDIAMRAGYTSEIDEGLGITGGLGVGFGNLRLDYVYIPYSDLGDTHRISLAMGFEREKTEKVKKEKRLRRRLRRKNQRN